MAILRSERNALFVIGNVINSNGRGDMRIEEEEQSKKKSCWHIKSKLFLMYCKMFAAATHLQSWWEFTSHARAVREYGILDMSRESRTCAFEYQIIKQRNINHFFVIYLMGAHYQIHSLVLSFSVNLTRFSMCVGSGVQTLKTLVAVINVDVVGNGSVYLFIYDWIQAICLSTNTEATQNVFNFRYAIPSHQRWAYANGVQCIDYGQWCGYTHKHTIV